MMEIRCNRACYVEKGITDPLKNYNRIYKESIALTYNNFSQAIQLKNTPPSQIMEQNFSPF